MTRKADHSTRKPTRQQVLLYVPNLIGYVRILLLVTALLNGITRPGLTYWLFAVNMTLDGLDGVMARRLNQTSAFGAFLDVFVDNLTRGTLWIWGLPTPWGIFPVVLEATAFTCTHKGGDAAWKSGGHFTSAPWWVQKVMANGFKTLPGSLAITGLMGTPLWLWAQRFYRYSVLASPLVGLVVVSGRLLCASVEIWVIWAHIDSLLQQ